MTDKDKAQMNTLFKQFDTNGDGQLGPNEISAMMKQLGLNQNEAKEWMRSVDDNGDGIISVDEFAEAAVVSNLAKADDKEAKAYFDLFDTDKNGYVDSKEIEKLCNFLTPDAAKQLINDVDANGDGKISFGEWLNAMKDINKKMPAGQSSDPKK